MTLGAPTVRRFTVVGALGLTTLIMGLLRSVLVASLTEVGDGQLPRLVLSQENLDFAEVAPGRKLKVQIGVRNAGGQRLLVRKTSSDCACCEDPSDVPAIIGPHKHEWLPIEIMTPSHPGAMTRVLAFETNDPKQPRFSVTVRASVSESRTAR